MQSSYASVICPEVHMDEIMHQPFSIVETHLIIARKFRVNYSDHESLWTSLSLI